MAVTVRSFRILADMPAVYDFLCDVYAPDNRNGVKPPFVEYALSSDWMDASLCHRWGVWEDDGKIAAFCFTENPRTDVYFCLRPGYEALAEEMVAYAEGKMQIRGEPQRLVIFEAQTPILRAAEKAGFHREFGYTDYGYYYDAPFERALPDGYRFTAPGEVDPALADECCWKGFDHEAEEGPWDGEWESSLHLMASPHFTGDCHVAVVDEKGKYACYGGMWWTERNKLAYLEPLCTVPEHRKKGLGAALLSEMARRMGEKGAALMTGGSDPFYQKIGFQPTCTWTFWKKA